MKDSLRHLEALHCPLLKMWQHTVEGHFLKVLSSLLFSSPLLSLDKYLGHRGNPLLQLLSRCQFGFVVIVMLQPTLLLGKN